MREILGRRRGFMWSKWSRRERSTPRGAALTYAERWSWPVVPGVGTGLAAEERRGSSRGDAALTCACARVDCAVPGAHPHDPDLLAATTDARMVGWWWTKRPDAPVLLATGRTVSAVSLPASAGVRALATLDAMGVRLGPVVATPTRTALLVAPYSMEELGELLHQHDWVPSSLRYHGRGGYVVLPPSRTGAGRVGWERAPQPGPGGGAPWLPEISVIVDTLVEAGSSAPDGSRLAY
ncbi:bifunctional DNA primase/polymerase [Streptomyces silvisoli]|uniref:Bifunctional DNA primase/polymerase n=1 Tax=Streptomyces silvisoli TaxID=3034235 RepID=A0ABT5ZM01_9ACTN|nr:bifunctional DNA primase/polymerase [Streptomyces silvisoli]MDF3290850.1 bifunctional DNA primase/polymerase [Streptomyces silvisoli]